MHLIKTFYLALRGKTEPYRVTYAGGTDPQP